MTVIGQAGGRTINIDMNINAPRPEGNSFKDVMQSFDAMRGAIDQKFEEAKAIEEGRKPPPQQ